MQTLRAIKGFAISLAIGIAAYASTAVITTTANINSVQASSFEKQLERIHKRSMAQQKRNFERQARNLARDTHRMAVMGTIGVASGGILLSPSDRRKMRKIQEQQYRNQQNYRNGYQYQQPQQYYQQQQQYYHQYQSQQTHQYSQPTYSQLPANPDQQRPYNQLPANPYQQYFLD